MILQTVFQLYILFLSFLGTPHVTYADDDRCPQWGDLEGFQREGLQRGRVNSILAFDIIHFLSTITMLPLGLITMHQTIREIDRN